MSECTKQELRDVLPDFERGALTGAPAVALEQHLATCADCRAELRLLRDARAVLGATPSLDTSRIVAAIAPSSTIRRGATAAVAQTRRRRAWAGAAPSRRAWLAAAAVMAIIATAVVTTNVGDTPGAGSVPPTTAQSEQPSAVTSVPSETTSRPTVRAPRDVEIVMGGGVSDLADADLESLLQVLDDVDTELDTEPSAILPVLEGEV